jgi:LytS/YehU family sensor histidine kinase
LESIRFEDRLRVNVAVDDAARHREVPSMLLQTLVENAIKHGVEETPAGGDLTIRARLDGKTLRIQVENTGHLSEPRAGSTQIGLTNARERLRILYGENASLALAACGEGRVAATLLIPAAA